MPSIKLIFVFLIAFLAACSSEGTKIYKVDYQNNFQAGVFSASIGNNTIFTNGPAVLEVYAEKKPKFFCYGVNKEVLCKLSINVKVDNDAAEEYHAATQSLKDALLKSGKNRSVLPERFVYYINNEKAEEEVLFVNNLQNGSISLLPITVSGKGISEEDAKINALKKFDKIVNILIDKR